MESKTEIVTIGNKEYTVTCNYNVGAQTSDEKMRRQYCCDMMQNLLRRGAGRDTIG